MMKFILLNTELQAGLDSTRYIWQFNLLYSLWIYNKVFLKPEESNP